MIWVESIDTNRKLMDKETLEVLMRSYENKLITLETLQSLLPTSIDQVDYSTFLVKQGIPIEEEIESRFDILDL